MSCQWIAKIIVVRTIDGEKAFDLHPAMDCDRDRGKGANDFIVGWSQVDRNELAVLRDHTEIWRLWQSVSEEWMKADIYLFGHE